MKLAVVVILYNPSEGQIKHFISLSEDYEVYAIDNSASYQDVLCKLDPQKYPNLFYKKLATNEGIATATNIGVEYAATNYATHILISDQDSILTKVFIDNYLMNYTELTVLYPFDDLIVGPYISNTNNIGEETAISVERYYKAGPIIASGMLMSIETYQKVGGMLDSLFIDLVDTEFCYRAQSLGCKIYISNNDILHHSVGVAFFKLFNIPIIESAPFRYYYRCRNFIFLTKLPYIPSKWKIKRLLRILFELVVYTFKGKFNIVYNSLHGLFDGLMK